MQIALRSASPAVRFGKQEMVLNLQGLMNFNGFCQILNWIKQTHTQVCDGASGQKRGQAAIDAGYLDSNQQPTAACTSYKIYPIIGSTATAAALDGETFKVLWDGGGNLSIGFAKPGSVSVNNTTRVATFTAGPDLIELTWTISGTPPSNIRVFQTRYENDVTLDGIIYPGVLNGGIFNPHWAHEIRNAKVLRFMDWMITNSSAVVNYSDIPTEAHAIWGQRKDDGEGRTKEGTPISLIHKLATLTGCDVWINVGHQWSDACITAAISELWTALSGTSTRIWVEYTNEPWNSSIGSQQSYLNTQSAAKYSPADGMRWYGFRAAQVAKLAIAAVGAGNRSRLTFPINVQTTWPDLATNMYTGIADWIADGTQNTLGYTQASQICDGPAVTGYFNDLVHQQQILAITPNTPAGKTTVTVDASLEPSIYPVGGEIRICLCEGSNSNGMPEIQGAYATIESSTYNAGLKRTDLVVNINSAGYSAFVFNDGGAYVSPSGYWRLMDYSEAQYTASPSSYRDKYEIFCQGMLALARAGSYTFAGRTITGNSATTITGHDQPSTGWWRQHKAAGDAKGMRLFQYEANSHFATGPLVNGRGVNNPNGMRYQEYCRAWGKSPEHAAMFVEGVSRFRAMGGTYPAKFSDIVAQRGGVLWGSFEYLPTVAQPSGDAGTSPVWQGVKAVMRADVRVA